MWCGTSINFVKHNLVAEGLCVPGDGIARCTGPALLWVLLQGWDFTWSQPYFIIYFIYDCISSGFMIPPTLHQLLWRYFPVSAVRPILFIITKHSRNVPLIHLPFGKDIILQQYKLLMRTIWGRKLWLNMINIQLCNSWCGLFETDKLSLNMIMNYDWICILYYTWLLFNSWWLLPLYFICMW